MRTWRLLRLCSVRIEILEMDEVELQKCRGVYSKRVMNLRGVIVVIHS